MLISVYDTDGDGKVNAAEDADTVGGHTVAEDVPANAVFTDTVYTHPASHLATMITEDTTHRFATDTEKSTWNGKQDALGYTPIPATQKGAVNGVAELDAGGKVLSAQLPSYVDDVLEYATFSVFPVTGESGKIYIDIATGLAYRWGGTAYAEISPSIALGETSSTAYRGDHGKTAYDHSQLSHAPSTAQANADITKAEIEAKLTGAITSHTHAYAADSHTHDASIIDVEDTLDYFTGTNAEAVFAEVGALLVGLEAAIEAIVGAEV